MPAALPPRHPYIGALAALAGVAVACMVYLQPDKLRAPAWVAYAAALAFFLAGMSMIAHAFDASRRLLAWIAVLLIACLVAPGLWIALAQPDGVCRMNLMGFFLPAPEWACRGFLLVCALVGVSILG